VVTISFALLALTSVGASQGASILPADRIHPGDLIEIDELGGFDFDWRGRLNPEGFLDGFSKVVVPIFARCKTTDELAELVRTAYSETLRDPQVRVRILDRSQRPVAYLEGAIRQPMRLQIRREVSLRELVVTAGGFSDRASGEVTVLRPEGQNCESPSDDATRTIKVTIAEILSGERAADLKIVSGDLILIHEVQPIYFIGGIGSPGKRDWREGATLSRVIASAGGVSNRGVAGRVTIFRRRSAGSEVIEADLDAIASGKAADIIVNAYDIIDVPLKGQAKRIMPPIVEAREPGIDRRSLPLRIID
jgi:protein involved in polysaccharide export with SLBB domain